VRRRGNTLVPYPPGVAVKQRTGEEALRNHAFKDTRPDKNGSKKRAGAPARVREEGPAGKRLLDNPQYQIDQHYDNDHSYNDADGVPRHPHLLPSLLASLRPMPRIAQRPEPR
jgi:hypothetical protein